MLTASSCYLLFTKKKRKERNMTPPNYVLVIKLVIKVDQFFSFCSFNLTFELIRRQVDKWHLSNRMKVFIKNIFSGSIRNAMRYHYKLQLSRLLCSYFRIDLFLLFRKFQSLRCCNYDNMTFLLQCNST